MFKCKNIFFVVHLYRKAMKQMSLIGTANIHAYFNEINQLKRLNSEYIVKYYENFDIDKYTCCLIIEYCQVSNVIRSI